MFELKFYVNILIKANENKLSILKNVLIFKNDIFFIKLHENQDLTVKIMK